MSEIEELRAAIEALPVKVQCDGCMEADMNDAINALCRIHGTRWREAGLEWSWPNEQRKTALKWVDWWNELAYNNDFLNDCPDPDALWTWFYERLCLVFGAWILEKEAEGQWVVVTVGDFEDMAKGFTAHEATISFLRGMR